MLNRGTKDLTSAQYEALGKLFVEWSNIEFLLGLVLSRLLFTPEFLGRTYSDEMNAAGLERAITNALDIHKHRYEWAVISEADDRNIRALLKEVAQCRMLRNKFAHYLWTRSNDEIIGYKMSGRPLQARKERDSKLRITMTKLRDAHLQSHALAENLINLVLSLPEVCEKSHLSKK